MQTHLDVQDRKKIVLSPSTKCCNIFKAQTFKTIPPEAAQQSLKNRMKMQSLQLQIQNV